MCEHEITKVGVIDMEKQRETGIIPSWKKHKYCIKCKKDFD